MSEITSVLIANRGEIAIRISKTLKRLGIKVCAVTSPLEQNPLHVKHADAVFELAGLTLADTYLNAEQIVQLCLKNKIDAVHPGYGFLSENADFARACQKAGIIFIGPSPEAIEAMGSKAKSKQLMIESGVPTIPGYNGEDQNLKTLIAAAERIGYPLLIKASAGGGGKGMRIVRGKDELQGAIQAAKSEGLKSFKDDRLIIEKYLENPRHIEFQIFGDQFGSLLHLGERECSIQRRHQKIVEETPSPALNADLRGRMADAALKCARAISYQNAGTVEMILDEKQNFYFLEMNTRLQVEHPITELLTGYDLVEWQIQVAQGNPLPLKQEDIVFRGHALECRVYAEDAECNFLPSIGKILYYHEPNAPFLRIDSAIDGHAEISIHFDPMIAKVIASGATRQEAISRMIWALENYPILGVKTNSAFLIRLLRHEAFLKGELNTDFIHKHLKDFSDDPDPFLLSALAGLLKSDFFAQTRRAASELRNAPSSPIADDPWQKQSGFRVGVL